MPVVSISGYDIHFPFEPYEIQKDLMKCVLDCLTSKNNGMLESPTGTGKTLSLLCSTLAWQKTLKPSMIRKQILKPPETQNQGSKDLISADIFQFPKIIYASRTHSQISQVVQELRRTFYRNTKSVVIGSRDMLCINQDVQRLEGSSTKIMACQAKVRSRSCTFYNNVNSKKEECAAKQENVTDIEDLVKTGKNKKFCPFYMSKELVSDADVIFMPYNYLLDPKLRSSDNIKLKNSVIILDEGHNIASICEESVSFQLSSKTVALCIIELTKALENYSQFNLAQKEANLKTEVSLEDIIRLKKNFLSLERALDEIKVTGDEASYTVDKFLDIFFSNHFGHPVNDRINAVALDSVCNMLSSMNKEPIGCNTFSNILRALTASYCRNNHKFCSSYKVHVKLDTSRGVSQMKIFDFWCFNPSIGLELVTQFEPRSIILASGTLSPMEMLEAELEIPFPVKLSNPHIIDKKQLFAGIVTKGPEGCILTSTYQNRSNKAYLSSLSQLVTNVCQIVPKGVLVFFPSYAMMDCCVKFWKENQMLTEISGRKSLLFEPRRKEEFSSIMENYYSNASGKGACLMAVCRGKVSEGLDFADDFGRAVIIVGIPYSPIKDPRIMAKMKYLDGMKERKLLGNEFYHVEAVRAVNQAIGRIIRHVNDYGAVLLCDDRCGSSSFLIHLSKWIKNHIQRFDSFDDSMRKLSSFFGSQYITTMKDSLHKKPIKKGLMDFGNMSFDMLPPEKPESERKLTMSVEDAAQMIVDCKNTEFENSKRAVSSGFQRHTEKQKKSFIKRKQGCLDLLMNGTDQNKCEGMSSVPFGNNFAEQGEISVVVSSPSSQFKSKKSKLDGNRFSSDANFVNHSVRQPSLFTLLPTTNSNDQMKRMKSNSNDSTAKISERSEETDVTRDGTITPSKKDGANKRFNSKEEFLAWMKTVIPEAEALLKFKLMINRYKERKNDVNYLFNELSTLFQPKDLKDAIHGVTMCLSRQHSDKIWEIYSSK